MWIWTLDEKLLNLSQVETVELVETYEEDADFDDIESGEAEPASYEVIAFLSSGRETVLYWHEQEALVHRAYELLAEFIGAHDMIDSFSQGKVLSLSELMGKVDEESKN